MRAFAPPERTAVLFVPAMQELLDAAGAGKAEVALVLMMGLPVPAEATRSCQCRLAAAAWLAEGFVDVEVDCATVRPLGRRR